MSARKPRPGRDGASGHPWSSPKRLLSWSGLLLSLGMLLGCYPRGDPGKPIPRVLLPAQHKPQRLVVVLPGRGDDLERLRKRGIDAIIRAQWPDADVELAGLTLGYYMAGNAERRLHDEIVAPARRRGYDQVWLLGISLGGMGAVLYERAHPGEVDGIVLLSPYLGEASTLQEIEAAGGVDAWQAGPAPGKVDADNFEHDIWRQIQDWSRHPNRAGRVWLAYGERDSLRHAGELLAPALPAGHVLVLPGAHDWDFWRPATRAILARVDDRH